MCTDQTPPQVTKKLPDYCYWIVCVVLVLALSAAGVWAIVFNLPCPKVPKLEVNTVIISPFNVSDTSPIATNWDIGFIIENRNKAMKYKYKDMNVSVYYKTEFLTGTILKTFVQHAKKQTLLNASSTGIGMADDLKNGSVPFNIFINGWIYRRQTYRYGDKIWMAASCPDVQVGLVSSTTAITMGKMLGGTRSCIVSFKINPKGDCEEIYYNRGGYYTRRPCYC